MNACQECGALLNFTGECGGCGWAPRKKDKAAGITGYPCQDCLILTNIKAGAIVVGGHYLCTSCHWVRLQATRSEPGYRCTVPGCELTVREHIDQYKQVFAKLMERALTL